MKQLDLLEWTKPATIIPFPAAKRIRKIKQTALMVREKRSEKALQSYWTQITDAMARQMLRSQLPPLVIAEELIAFENAVTAEVRRLDLDEGLRSGP